MANITKWRHGIGTKTSPLSHVDYETLDKFIYNRSGTQRLEGSVPVSTTVDTFYLGEQHGISSNGENIFFQNQTTGINWFSPWAGLKDHTDPANRGEDGLIFPTYRQYSKDVAYQEFNGSITTDVVDYISETTTPVPISFFGLDFVIAEDITTDYSILYRVYIDLGTGLNGARLIYEQQKNGNYTSGDTVDLWFDQPIEAFPGFDFIIVMYKKFKNNPEELLQVKGTASTNPNLGTLKPWVNIKYRTFVDIPLNSDPVAIFITDVKANPPSVGTVVTTKPDGFNVESITTTTANVQVFVEWDRGQNHLDAAEVNGVPVNVQQTQGGTHYGSASIVLDLVNGEDIEFRVGRAARKLCLVTQV